MSDVIHATARAIEVVSRRLTECIDAKGPDFTFACNRRVGKMKGHFVDGDATMIVLGHQPAVWPTCAECRVLLDAALERPEASP